jgi:two-component system KDP operon response regulator KdpE
MSSTRKILIIDDDPVTRRVLHSALSAANFLTVMAADALGALMRARAEQPDLILLDLGLPGGGGLLVLDRLRQFPQLAVIPVIVISGLDRAANEPRALAAGAVAYVTKPILHERVVDHVKSILAA